MTVFLFPHPDNFHHAKTCKHKVCSRCSTGKLVRAPFLIHCALNKYERANLHGFHSRISIGACADAWRSCWRRRLTPPLRQHRHAFTDSRKSWTACLSLPRARVARHGSSKVSRAFHPFRHAMIQARGQALKPRRCAPRLWKEYSPPVGRSVRHLTKNLTYT